MSDIHLLICDYLTDEEALIYLKSRNPEGLKKYKLKAYLKWSEIKKHKPQSIVQNLIYNSAMPMKEIPNTVINLVLGDIFDHDIDNLPNLLTLTTGKIFNSKLKLPSTLKKLSLGEEFEGSILEIPDTLIQMYIENYNPKEMEIVFPRDVIIKNIRTCECCYGMPMYVSPGVKKLVVLDNIQKTLFLTEGIEELEVPFSDFESFQKLPNSLRILKLGKHFN
jgi:hypothetical protein